MCKSASSVALRESKATGRPVICEISAAKELPLSCGVDAESSFALTTSRMRGSSGFRVGVRGKSGSGHANQRRIF